MSDFPQLIRRPQWTALEDHRAETQQKVFVQGAVWNIDFFDQCRGRGGPPPRPVHGRAGGRLPHGQEVN
jgi:hypothetical protein